MEPTLQSEPPLQGSAGNVVFNFLASAVEQGTLERGDMDAEGH